MRGGFAFREKPGTMKNRMVGRAKICAHLRGLQITANMEYRCPDCGDLLGLEGVVGWVREAERIRDKAYLMVEGDEFSDIVREEGQREVYRRRKLLYELQDIPRTAARPEMLLVVYDAREGCYECRVFYKEPKPVWCIERLSVEAGESGIRGLGEHSDPVVRTVAEKVAEFHEARKVTSNGGPAPTRRVFYSNEL